MECCYIPVLLWKRVLLSWDHILKTAKARHSNVIPFDSQYTTVDIGYKNHLFGNGFFSIHYYLNRTGYKNILSIISRTISSQVLIFSFIHNQFCNF